VSTAPARTTWGRRTGAFVTVDDMPPAVNAASTWTADLDPHVAPDITRSALIIIDTQADFVDGGSSPVAGTTQVLDDIVRLQHAYRAAVLPIVHVVRLYDGEDVDLPRRTAISRGEPIVRPGERPAARSSPNCAAAHCRAWMPPGESSTWGRGRSPSSSRAGVPSTAPRCTLTSPASVCTRWSSPVATSPTAPGRVSTTPVNTTIPC